MRSVTCLLISNTPVSLTEDWLMIVRKFLNYIQQNGSLRSLFGFPFFAWLSRYVRGSYHVILFLCTDSGSWFHSTTILQTWGWRSQKNLSKCQINSHRTASQGACSRCSSVLQDFPFCRPWFLWSNRSAAKLFTSWRPGGGSADLS